MYQEYNVCCEGSVKELIAVVNMYTLNNWRVQGGVATELVNDCPWYLQAVVRTVEEEDEG